MGAAADDGRREAMHFSPAGMIATLHSAAASSVAAAICLSQAVAQAGEQQGHSCFAAAPLLMHGINSFGSIKSG